MNFNEYQNRAAATSGSHGYGAAGASVLEWLGYSPEAARNLAVQINRDSPDCTQRLRMLVAGLGLAGEAGEVAELVKKAAGHRHPLDLTRLREELGDVLWYIAELATAAGLSLEQIARRNLDKLAARYPQGFSTEASLRRVS